MKHRNSHLVDKPSSQKEAEPGPAPATAKAAEPRDVVTPMANQALTLAIGQTVTWTPNPGGSDNNTVGPDGYNLTFANSNSSTVQVVLNPVTNSNAKTAQITALVGGNSTITWTLTPQGFYGGNAVTQVDTITVSAGKRTITGANGTYGTPAG